MSSYEKMPRKAKIVGQQHGMKRITARSYSAVGCPKILEAWVPIPAWEADPQAVTVRIKEACRLVHGVELDDVYMDF